jgi:hypothetical protein
MIDLKTYLFYKIYVLVQDFISSLGLTAWLPTSDFCFVRANSRQIVRSRIDL